MTRPKDTHVLLPVIAKTAFPGLAPGATDTKDQRVYLKRNRFGKDGKDLVLVIDGTPGQWTLDTLLGASRYSNEKACWSSNTLMIDAGQDWKVTNLHELLAAALTWLQEKAPI